MDCREAQEHILESLSAPGLEAHVATCEGCRAFSETQLSLDRQLSAILSAPPLSPAFRASLKNKIRHEPLTVWPDWLPDIAHLAGCAAATALSLAVLPFPKASVITASLAFTLVTYAAQAVARTSLES